MKTWINLPPPESIAIALTRPDSELWKGAYNIEHRALQLYSYSYSYNLIMEHTRYI
jgi:hypothetical protein